MTTTTKKIHLTAKSDLFKKVKNMYFAFLVVKSYLNYLRSQANEEAGVESRF